MDPSLAELFANGARTLEAKKRSLELESLAFLLFQKAMDAQTFLFTGCPNNPPTIRVRHETDHIALSIDNVPRALHKSLASLLNERLELKTPFQEEVSTDGPASIRAEWLIQQSQTDQSPQSPEVHRVVIYIKEGYSTSHPDD